MQRLSWKCPFPDGEASTHSVGFGGSRFREDAFAGVETGGGKVGETERRN